MAVVRNIKKQDDKYLTALRELVTNGGSNGGNRQCFDCGQKGPTYVNMTIGSFVCTRCSGVLRGLTPPHRVKSISMATFTQDEIDYLKAHGNTECAKTWLGLWDPKRAVHQDHRELMIDKYERKRYFLEPASPLKSLTNTTSLISNIVHSNSTTTNGNGLNHSTDSATTKNENMLTNGNKQQQQQQQIHLKPPNGMRKSHSNNSSNNNNNNNNNNSNNTNGSKNNDVTAINRVHQMENAFNLKQSANKLLSETTKTTTTTISTENGFGADTNFVADFGTANIFNATANMSNGYAKIQQSNKIAQQQQQQHITNNNNRTTSNNNNNHNNINKNYQFMNGDQETTTTATTTTTSTTKITNGSSNNENFADFDHAPIYNAAGNNLGINDINDGHSNNVNGNMKYQFVRKTNIRKKPPLYDLQQIALQQKRQNEQEFDDDFVTAIRSTPTTTTATYSIDDIFFKNQNEQQQQERNICANTTTNPFCDKNNSYFSFNEEEEEEAEEEVDPFNHNACTKQQQQENNINKQKFTPLALAAHATAMAVLQKDYHFNNDHNNKRVSFSDGFSQSKQPYPPHHLNIFDNNNDDNDEDDDWYNGTGSGLEWRSYMTNENENPNNMKSMIGQQQQTPSKSEYNQNSISTYDVYNTTWCTNDLHKYNNQYNNNNSNNIAAAFNQNVSNVGNGDGNYIYMDKSTTSFPITKGMHNNSANNNNNNNNDNQRNNGKFNRTPSEDRYAALKDLDEQLRESKSFTDTFSTNNISSNGSINPFKSQQHQQQHQQQQQQQQLQAPQTAQQQIMANPFQTQPAANYYQAQMTIMPNNTQNMAGMSAQNYYNYNNRFVVGQHALGATNMQTYNGTSTGPNACGFGFNTMQQEIMVKNTAEDYNNPFVVNGSMNSNNPFL